MEQTQASLTVNPVGAWGHDAREVKTSLEEMMASLRLTPQRESRTRKAGSPVRRDHARNTFVQTRIMKLNTRPRKKSSKPKRPKSARLQLKDIPSNMHFPKDFDVFSFRSSPVSSARWMQLAARVRISETPEGSKQQPTSVSRPLFAMSIGDSRRRTRRNPAFVVGPGAGVGTGIFESSPQPSKQRLAFKPFRLLDLPLEMREAIYGFVVQQNPTGNTNSGKLHLSLNRRCTGTPSSTITPKISRLPYATFALLSTNKQIRREALPLLYRLNTFYARAMKSLPQILALPYAPANLLTLDLSFGGLKSRAHFFSSLNAINSLSQLRTLNLTFNYETLLGLATVCLMPNQEWTVNDICAHQSLHDDDDAREEYCDLFAKGEPPKRHETRKIRVIFKRASSSRESTPERLKQGEAPAAEVLDCVPCAVVKGFREMQRQMADRKKELFAAEPAVGFLFSMGIPMEELAKKAGVELKKPEVPTVVVLRTTGSSKVEGTTSDLQVTNEKGTGEGLWPILTPEPASCTDWAGSRREKPSALSS